MRLLITGGTGTLGHALIRRLLRSVVPDTAVCVLSRDEVKQAQMRETFGPPGPWLKYFLGDVRDRDRLALAVRGCDAVIHAAALKRMETGAVEPEEMVKTNIVGTINVVHAAMEAGVRRVLVVSTDKAANPSTMYGATKMVAERFAIGANAFAWPAGCHVSVVRYGNVLDSRGSVLHVFRSQAAAGQPLTVTDARCTRFLMTSAQAAGVALAALDRMGGGETFVPSWLPGATIMDLAEAVAPGHPVEERGFRAGTNEKLHEELVTGEEARRVSIADDFFVIHPEAPSWRYEAKGLLVGSPEAVERLRHEGMAWRSDAARRMSVEEIRALIEVATQAERRRA